MKKHRNELRALQYEVKSMRRVSTIALIISLIAFVVAMAFLLL